MVVIAEGVKVVLPKEDARISGYTNGLGSSVPSSDIDTSGTGRAQLKTVPITSGT
jgi:hypothetical protein